MESVAVSHLAETMLVKEVEEEIVIHLRRHSLLNEKTVFLFSYDSDSFFVPRARISFWISVAAFASKEAAVQGIQAWEEFDKIKQETRKNSRGTLQGGIIGVIGQFTSWS